MDLFEQLFHLHDPQKPLYQEKLLFYTFQRAQLFSSLKYLVFFTFALSYLLVLL